MINHPGVPVPSRPFRLHRPLACSAHSELLPPLPLGCPLRSTLPPGLPSSQVVPMPSWQRGPPTTEGTKAAPAPSLSPTPLLSPLRTAQGHALCSGVYLGPDSSPTRTEMSSGESVWCLLAPADVRRPRGGWKGRQDLRLASIWDSLPSPGCD